MTRSLPLYARAGRVIRRLAWLALIVTVVVPAYRAVSGLFDTGSAAPAFAPGLIVLGLAWAAIQFKLAAAVSEHRPWGRRLGILWGILYLFAFPIGTLIGGWVLWCLIKGWTPQRVG